MANIDDVRLNGVLTSETDVPYVAPNPVITWEYDGTVDDPSPVSIEIRIGDSSSNWGYSDFSGNTVHINEETTSVSRQIEGNSLLRGTLYYGQIRSTDIDGDSTGWFKFKFYINRLPFVANISLLPSSPRLNDNIDLSYVFSDLDGHSQSNTKIRWYRNNLPVPKYDDLCTLPSSATKSGDSWTAKVVPYDGIEYGVVSETTAVVVQSGDFGFDEVKILPIDANVDDLLKVEWTLTENEYVSIIGDIEIEWFINGISVPDSNKSIIRLDTDVGDVVTVSVSIVDGDSEIATATSESITIQDVLWNVFNLHVNGLMETDNVSTLTPILEWDIHKTTAVNNEKPNYLQVLITRTPSMDGAVFDSGVLEYTKNSYIIPNNILSRGHKYFFHIGAGDESPIPSTSFITQEVQISGSSWEFNVDNSIGWTVEMNVSVDSGSSTSNMGLYIHDGKYFCSVNFFLDKIVFLSGEKVEYTISSGPNLSIPRTFKISGKNSDVKIFMNNILIMNAEGVFTNKSKLKRLEFGDIDGKNNNIGTLRFIRYSTDGAYGLDESLADDDTFYFSSFGSLPNGSIKSVLGDIIAWLPDDETQSSKLIKFNTNSTSVKLSTVTKNFSPITKIVIDGKRNKFIGAANGVTGIYGEKHDPDFELDTSDNDVQIPSSAFDLISNVPEEKRSLVESDDKQKWFTIDTTYRTIGVPNPNEVFEVEDEYNPYVLGLTTHAIHYYSQRTHGHYWYDRVDNERGWQVQFLFKLDMLEADDFSETNLEKNGFGVYVNDGTYQEIIYFYEDRIRLFYANVFVPINNTLERRFAIVGKGQNLKIYQTLQQSGLGAYQLLLDASGMFVTPSSKVGNSRKPKIVADSSGNYHAVWHDDNNKQSQIFYSYYDGSSWSTPEVVSSTKNFNARNPSIDVDDLNRVWVVYEDTSWGMTEISVSVKDLAGWNPKMRVTNFKSDKFNPDIKIDVFGDVNVVWEDNRNKRLEIFWSKYSNQNNTWISSGYFGEDTAVMQNTDQTAIDFKNPKLSLTHPYLWLVCEGCFADTGYSGIYLGNRNIELNTWNTSGSPILDDDGNVVSFGSSSLISSAERICVNPSIASSESRSTVVVVWEDKTGPISQIWGYSSNTSGSPIVSATQITNQHNNCSNPSVGFVYNQAVIMFEKNGSVLSSSYNTSYHEFIGTNTGGNDYTISLDDSKSANYPSMPPNVISRTFVFLYDFQYRRDTGEISDVEFPDFHLIGDAIVEHSESSPSGILSTTETIRNGIVSEIDTKEFAFGDFSENVGMRAHWRDIKMYFGYDAIPQSISKFNSDTVNSWLDNRINDLFIDVYGNIVAATFSGLLYHNTTTGKTIEIKGLDKDGNPLLENKLTTSVAWGKNGIWYVGTTEGLFYSNTAGRFWLPLHSEQLSIKIIYSIVVNKLGQAICSVRSSSGFDSNTDGVYVCHPDLSTPVFIKTEREVRVVEVDESGVIWAGGDTGLIRIENQSSNNILFFNVNSGMKSSHVSGIVSVNKHLRYIATAAGIERMNGTKFFNMNTKNFGILNNNISSITFDKNTNSLWVGSLYTLHEIVFRDEAHEIIENETVHYNTTEISTESSYDDSIYYVLDFDVLNSDGITLSTESSKVFINKNVIDFGYTVDDVGQSIVFDTELLVGDNVEIELSNRFIDIHSFNQNNVEKSVKGFLRRSIEKMDRTNKGQVLLLSGLDKPEILLFNDQQLTNLPFTTIMLDRDPPVGCLEKLETITRSVLRFKILAFDQLSGLDGYILSNYENFTSDGETPLEFSSPSSIVEHDIGDSINNVVTSLTFSSTVEINTQTYNVGTGRVLGKYLDESSQTEILFAVTGQPIIVYKYNPILDTWSAIQAINPSDQLSDATEMKTLFNSIYLTTGTSTPGGNGAIYRSSDGATFNLVGSVTGAHARGIAATPDGIIYFGSSDGKIYQLNNNVFSVKYQNIGQSIYSLDVFEDTLVVGTGSQGRVYIINLTTDDNLIVFDGSETKINRVHIKDANLLSSPDQTFLFVGSSDSTTIYRSNLDTYEFVKSYSSFNKDINQIKTVDTSSVTEPSEENVSGTITVAAVGDSLFKNIKPAWEFFYKHSEDILDFIQYFSNGVDGVWVISDSKVTKWTALLTEKTVYLRLKDKAGNISSQPVTTPSCPNDQTEICCNYAYSINIADLKDFVNESRIVDITEYGQIVFTYDAPNNRQFFSADQIDEEVGVYTSEIFNGSNDLVSWKSISWESNEPSGTSVSVQIRSSVTNAGVEDEIWSETLVVNDNGLVSIEHITDQYIQFRIILRSQVRDLSPTLSSVTLRNITAQASHFFTTNFIMPSRPIKGLLTTNTFVPVSADIVFGITTNNSTDFGDYQIIEPNRLFSTSQGQFGSNIRIGAKLLSPGIPSIEATNNPGDPYDASSFICSIDFEFENIESSTVSYEFRARFYNDPFRTQLIHTFFTGNDQTGWGVNGSENNFPLGGLSIGSGQRKSIIFVPGGSVSQNQRWYITIDAWNGNFFETVFDNQSYICSNCNISNEPGLVAEYYSTGLSDLSEIPNFSSLTPDRVCIETSVNFANTSSAWISTSCGSLGSDFVDSFAIRLRGKIQAPLSGLYSFILTSDDGSVLFIDNEEIISMNELQPLTSTTATIELTEGFHDIEIHYFEGGGSAALSLKWILPGEINATTVPSSRLFHSVLSEYCADIDTPKILNFAVLFELENGESVKINLDQ